MKRPGYTSRKRDEIWDESSLPAFYAPCLLASMVLQRKPSSKSGLTPNEEYAIRKRGRESIPNLLSTHLRRQQGPPLSMTAELGKSNFLSNFFMSHFFLDKKVNLWFKEFTIMDKLEFGPKIRRLRYQNGFTLQKVAERTGFTKSYLSMLESGKKFPAVATLSKIAHALNVDIATFFKQKDSQDKIVVTPKGKGEIIVRDGTIFGYRYEAIAPTKRMKKMEPFIVSVTSSGNISDVTHDGEELMYILEGKIHFYYENKKYLLGRGDCIYLDSSVPHRSENVGKKPAKTLTVIYTPPWKEAV